MYTYMYIYIYICIYIYIYVYVQTLTQTHLYVYVHTYTYPHLDAHARVHRGRLDLAGRFRERLDPTFCGAPPSLFPCHRGIRHDTTLYYNVLHELYYTILYYTIPYHANYYIILYYTKGILYCTILLYYY